MTKLQRVYWQTGQVLLPEHLVLQEESILSDIALRFQQENDRSFGVSKLKWQEELLKQGIFSITDCTIILPSGTLLVIPDNTNISSLDLNNSQQTEANIYFHYLKEKLEIQNELTNKAQLQACLSVSSTKEGALESFLIASFQKNCDGTWVLNTSFSPALLTIGPSPFFQSEIKKLKENLTIYQQEKAQKLSSQQLVGQNSFEEKLILMTCYSLSTLLEESITPYELYLNLIKTSQTLSLFYEKKIPKKYPSYSHTKPHDCLLPLFETLFLQLASHDTIEKMLRLDFNEHIFFCENLPKELLQAKEAYLLIQKQSVNESFSLESFKVSTQSRLTLIHQLALPGIPLQKLSHLPFNEGFGAEVEVFSLQFNDEWNHVLKEETLAFYKPKELTQTKAFLCWR